MSTSRKEHTCDAFDYPGALGSAYILNYFLYSMYYLSEWRHQSRLATISKHREIPHGGGLGSEYHHFDCPVSHGGEFREVLLHFQLVVGLQP